MTSKQKYILTQRHQLIDLNKTLKNFKLQFQVLASEPTKDFFAFVLTQEQLDQTELNTLDMKLAKGRIGGTITADTDKYQNYFLVLRSVQPEDNTEVEVTIQLEEIEPQKNKTQENFTNEQSSTASQSSPDDQPGWKRVVSNPWFWVVVAAVIVIGGYYLYTRVYQPYRLKMSCPPITLPSAPEQPVLADASPSEAGEEVIPSTVTTTAPRKKTVSNKKELYNKLAQIA